MKRIHISFNSSLVILSGGKGTNERLCAIEPHLQLRQILPTMEFEHRQLAVLAGTFLIYETEFVLFLGVLENSVLPMGWDSSRGTLKVTSEL